MTLSLPSFRVTFALPARKVRQIRWRFLAFLLITLSFSGLSAQEIQSDTSRIVSDSVGISTRDTLPKKDRVNYFGVRLGGTLPYFNHQKGNPEGALSGNIFPNWHAGLSLDMFTRKYYHARIDLEYINKGAKETFQGRDFSIHAENKLQYAQLSVLPIVVKPGFKKVNPYLGFGGYYAYQIGKKSYYTIDSGERQTDDVTNDLLSEKQDYGLCVSLGMYLKKKPLVEVKYAWGLVDVMPGYGVKNRSLSLSICF